MSDAQNTYDPDIADVLGKAAEFMLEPGRTCRGAWIHIDETAYEAILGNAMDEGPVVDGPATALYVALEDAVSVKGEIPHAVAVSRFCDANNIPYSACAEGAVAVAAQRTYEDDEEAIDVANAAIRYVNDMLYGKVGSIARHSGQVELVQDNHALFTVNDDHGSDEAQQVLAGAFDKMVMDVAFRKTYFRDFSA